MYKLIAIDLDGTLLNSHKHVSQENRKSIRLAMDKGVKVVICSGRIFVGARVFANEVGITSGPLIGCNGAVIKELDTQQVLYSKLLNMEDCFRIIDICKGEGLYYHAYVGDTLYTERLEFSALNYHSKNQKLPEHQRVDIKLVENLKNTFEYHDTPATKFVVVSEDVKQLARARKLAEELSTVGVMSSDHNNFEIVNCEVNKGAALSFITQRLGINQEEVIAIGDNENDYSMIEYAGLGVAMGNAQESIKGIADYVTSTNDCNGVSEVIKKFVL